MSSEPQSTAPASDPHESETRLCDICESEPAVVFCVGCDGEDCDRSNLEDEAPYAYCADCNMSDNHDRDPVRCGYHSIIEWTFEDAFSKFGFEDGDSWHNYTWTLANAIKEIGYIVVYGTWGCHNTLILDIIRPHPGVEPAVHNVIDDPEFDIDGFVKLDLGPEGARVLKMRGGNIALEAFKSLAPDDVLCGICQQTSAEMVMEPLTKVREAELKRLLAVPRCESEAPHLFHRACLKEWLSHSPIHVRCPMCRSVVVGTPTAGTIPSSQETEV
jgi:hypothetical protein